MKIEIAFEMDRGYWNILPSMCVNRHTKGIEIEFLCFGIYINLIHK